MPFIGVISKKNDFNYIKNNINKNINGFELLNLNINNIENYKNIKFEIIVIHEDIKELINKSNHILNIINNSKYILVNLDEYEIKKDNFEKNNLITYGFNSNSKITVSSINEEIILFCIQEKLYGNKEIVIEEQEIKLLVKKYNTKKIYNIMVILIILKIYGKNLKKI